MDRADRPDRDQVLAREERGGRIVAAKQVGCGLIRVDPPELRMADQAQILCQAVLSEGLLVPPQPLRSREDVRPVAEEADPRVPRRDQVRDRARRAAGVVGHDRVGVEEARRAVDEHQRHAGRALAQQVGAVVDRGGDDQAVDAAGAERLGELDLPLGLLVGAAHEREHAARPRDVLHPAVDRPEERVRHVLEDQADARRLAVRPAQRAGGEVVPVAEQLDRLAHPADEIVAHAVAAVDDARDGAEAHARDGRDLAHRRAARGAPLRLVHPHGRRYYASKKTISRLDCNK